MNFPALITKIQSVQSALQSAAAHAVNTALTVRNWLIGYCPAWGKMCITVCKRSAAYGINP